MNRKTGVIMSGILMVFEMLSTLLYTPYLIRTLGQSEYGIYTLVLSVTLYLTLLDLGVGNSIVRYVSKYRALGNNEEQKRFLGVATVYYAIIAIVVLVVGGIIILFLPDIFAKGLTGDEIVRAKQLMVVTVLNASVTMGTSPYVHTLTAYEKFYISKGISIVQILVKLSVSFIVLYLGMGSLGVVTVTFVSNLLMRTVLICYISFKMKLTPTYKNIEFKFVKQIASYSIWILLQMIATQINHMADHILIGMFAASSSVILGIYGVGAQINQYFQSVSTAFTGVLMPGVVRLVETDGSTKALQKEMERIGRIIFMVTGFIWSVFLVFGKQFVALWAGQENSSAYIVAVLLMFPFVFIMPQSIGTQILWAKEKHKLQSILKFAIVILNVVLTIILIKKWDALLGATIGTFISLMLGDVFVMQIVFKKDIGINLLSYYKNTYIKEILPCLLLSIIGGFAFRGLNLTGWLGFVVNCGIMVAIYGVTMLLYGMNDYEKNLLFKPFKKILKKFHIVKEV